MLRTCTRSLRPPLVRRTWWIRSLYRPVRKGHAKRKPQEAPLPKSQVISSSPFDLRDLHDRPLPLTSDQVHSLLQECLSREQLSRDLVQRLAAAIEPQLLERACLFAYLCIHAGTVAQGAIRNVERKFEAYLRVCDISRATALNAALCLVRARREAPIFFSSGIEILHCLSMGRYEEATWELGVMTKRVLLPNPSHLGSYQSVYSALIDDLHRLADGGSILAATLLADFSVHSDGAQASLQHWNKAIALATAQPSKSTATSARTLPLVKPWIGLAELQKVTLKNNAAANDALRKGMALEDPDAYCLFSRWNTYEPGQDLYAYLEWLNATTKSAASGDILSALNLGMHYAEHPLPKGLESVQRPAQTGLFSILSGRFARSSVSTEASHGDSFTGPLTSAQQDVAAFAYSARTPEARVRLALEWLQIAARARSVMALVVLSVLHSRESIFEENNISLPLIHHAANGSPNPFLEKGYAKECLAKVATYNEIFKDLVDADASTMKDIMHRFPTWFSDTLVAVVNEESHEANWDMAKRLARELGVDVHPSTQGDQT